MARGIANGEGVVSQANSKAYEAGYDAAGLGKSDRSKERGRWVYDPVRQKLVRPWEYDAGNVEQARSAPISTDRYYENTASPIDGADIGSRRKYQEYLRSKGLTNASDFDSKGGEWDRAQKTRAQGFSSSEQRRDRQERLAREMYRIQQLPQAKYDREVKERSRIRAMRGTGEPTK